tara:strand:- start:375 stop:557 length:183 start_codon:yes stop_codon:yes gene_type:complete
MGMRLIGNDIELDHEKVARLFDINATTRIRLEEAIERSNSLKSKINDAYEEGKIDGSEGK